MSALQLPEGMHVFERGWLSSNNVLFTDGDRTLLVDSGYCTHAVQTASLVDGVLAGRTLDCLVNTHLHSDHCGGNAKLQTIYPQLQTFIPPGHADDVAQWDATRLTYLPTGQQCPRFSFTEVLRPGSEMKFGSKPWQIHAAAGHDPHSLIFFEPEKRILISADALWESGFGVVFPELEGEDAFIEVGATLDLIEHLQPDVVVPGHGRVFKYSPEVLALARQRLEAFQADPLKHAKHAAKVLLKFKLLELQRHNFAAFKLWAEATPHLMQIRSRFFAGVEVSEWLDNLCADLVRARAARFNGELILNE